MPDRNESGMMLIKSHFLLPNLLIKSRVLFRESRVNNEKKDKEKEVFLLSVEPLALALGKHLCFYFLKAHSSHR